MFNTSFSQTITPTYISDQYKTAGVSPVAGIQVQTPDAIGVIKTPVLNIKKPKDGTLDELKNPKSDTPSTPPPVTDESDVLGKRASTVERDAVNFAKFARMMQDPKFRAKFAESNISSARDPHETTTDRINSTLERAVVNAKSTGKHVEVLDVTHKGVMIPLVSKNEELEETVAKKASVIDKIAGTVTQHMKDSFFAELEKNASIAEGFKRNNTQEPIQKLAAIAPSVVNFNERVRKELDRDIHYIYKTGSHEWRGIFGNSHVVDPVEISLDAVAAERMEHVRAAAIIELDKQASAPIKGMFKTAEAAFVVFDNNDYTELPSRLVEDVGTKLMYTPSEPEITKAAVWETIDGQYTRPFEITRIWTDGTKERIETWDGMDKISYIRMQGIDTPYTEGGFTYLPKDAQIIKLGNRVAVNDRTLPDPTLTNEVLCIDKNAYILKGEVFAQYLKSDARQYDMHKTAWHSIQCGGTKEDIEKIAQLTPGKSYRFAHHLNVPLPFDKVAQKMTDEYDLQVKRIHKGLLGKEWTKLASVITDTPTVDAVLSLNFVTRDNIIEFAQALPLFTDVSQKLADMLLKTRVGVRLVDENVLRRVMLGIVDVIDVLSGVANLAGRK